MSCKSKRHEQLCWAQATVRNTLQEKYKATLTPYYNINSSVAFSESCHAELSPPVLQSTFLIFPPTFLLLPDLIAMRHPEIVPDGSLFPADSLLPSQSVGEKERKGGDIPAPAAPRRWGQPWQELCRPLRPALAHTPSRRAAKMFQRRANVLGRRRGCI